MKLSVISTAATGLCSVVAGVAIAGLPSSAPGGLVIEAVPTTTTTTATAATATTDGVSIASNEDAVDVTSSTVVPTTTVRATTTVPDDSDAADDPVVVTTTTVAEPPSTLAPLTDPAELTVATANAAGVGGIATSTATLLSVIGYPDVVPSDADELADVSIVYHADGLAGEAARMAAQLNWSIDAIAPMSELPALNTSDSFDLVAVIGIDRAGPLDEL